MNKRNQLASYALVGLATIALAGCTHQPTAEEKAKQQLVGWVREDNVYSHTVTYESPGGVEENIFHITIDKGSIANVNVEVKTNIAASIEYQQDFAKEIGKKVVGKKLSEIANIDTISGASLTTKAFNDALQKLKLEVK